MHGSALQNQRNVSACLSLLLSWLLDADADAPPPLIVAQVCALGFLIVPLKVWRILSVWSRGKLLHRIWSFLHFFLHVFERAQHASRGAGGRRSPGLIPRHTVRASFSWRPPGDSCASAPPPDLLAMSTRKASLTDKQAKNGTSKYVLERCASVNEYYDIAFKVCISCLCCAANRCVTLTPHQEKELYRSRVT